MGKTKDTVGIDDLSAVDDPHIGGRRRDKCRVSGVDLTWDYVETANRLS
jgi:hypothetical protein